MPRTERLISKSMQKHMLAIAVVLSLVAMPTLDAHAQVTGVLKRDGRELFPIGWYSLPKDDPALKEMAEAGINLVRCKDTASLDRVAAAGMQGWVALQLQRGNHEKLRKQILAVKDHPALAVWEGPDEIVHTFTAISLLYKVQKIHKSPDDWRNQAPVAVEYAEQQAATIIPGIRDGAKLVRSLDKLARPIWINEAADSDLKYVRGYVDNIDIIGCDIYPVSHANKIVIGVGDATELWKRVGRGQKPVWMVLQAFSWHELGDYYGQQKECYPSFDQSRLMAYDVIVHGAKGIAYWGANYVKSNEFLQSLYAVTRELAALQPFLVAPEVANASVEIIESQKHMPTLGVRMTIRKVGDEWLVVLVNEDDRAHMGVEVSGLDAINGRRLVLLYGDEESAVERGELITRMLPYQVKIFATSRKWETNRLQGRTFGRLNPK